MIICVLLNKPVNPEEKGRQIAETHGRDRENQKERQGREKENMNHKDAHSVDRIWKQWSTNG